MKVIEFENVFFKYDETSQNQVINGLSFSVSEGEMLCVLGENGSGKSTVARLINGLLTPDSGKITVMGLDTSDKTSIFEIRKQVGMVFQNPDNQMVATMVEDDIAFGPENLGIPPLEIDKRIEFSLKSTGMLEYRNAQAQRLSGGQKQRIAIAGVLAIQPKILILDESTSMLDPKGRQEVMNVVKNLNKQGITVIYITHYMDEATYADRVIVINEGKIAIEGTPEEIFKNDNLNEFGLELPRAVYIKNKLKENGFYISDGVLTAESLAEEVCKLLQKI